MQNPLTKFAVERIKQGESTKSILDAFIASDLYDGVAQRRVMGNRVAVIRQALEAAEDGIVNDPTRAAKVLSKTMHANDLEVKLRTYDMVGEQAIRKAEGLSEDLWECKDIMVRASNNVSNPWYITQGKFTRRTDIDPVETLKRLSHLIEDYKPLLHDTPTNNIASDYMLEVDPPDAHIGMQTYDNSETLDTQIAKYIRACLYVLGKAPEHVDKIVFVVGSDLFHINADRPETKRGTPQEVNTTPFLMCDAVTKALIDLIFTFMTHANTIEVKVVPGNHDSHNVMWLGVLLNQVYKNVDMVRIDYAQEERKYLGYGCTVVAFMHKLDKDSDRLSVKMFHEMKDRGLLTPEVKYYEAHGGHLHQPGKKDIPSETTNQKMTQRVLSALCSSGKYSVDAYGLKTIESQGFLYSRDKGIEDVFIYRE